MKEFNYRAHLKMAAIWGKVRVRKRITTNFPRMVIYINLDDMIFEGLLHARHFACGSFHPCKNPMTQICLISSILQMRKLSLENGKVRIQTQAISLWKVSEEVTVC